MAERDVRDSKGENVGRNGGEYAGRRKEENW